MKNSFSRRVLAIDKASFLKSNHKFWPTIWWFMFQLLFSRSRKSWRLDNVRIRRAHRQREPSIYGPGTFMHTRTVVDPMHWNIKWRLGVYWWFGASRQTLSEPVQYTRRWRRDTHWYVFNNHPATFHSMCWSYWWMLESSFIINISSKVEDRGVQEHRTRWLRQHWWRGPFEGVGASGCTNLTLFHVLSHYN